MSLKFLSEMFEILGEDIAQTQVKDRRYGGEFKFDKARKANELGRGVFSKVSTDEDPHMVQKQTHVPLGKQHMRKADGFDAFVRMLVDNDLMDNIHFPKVYVADTNTDRTGTRRHSYKMERLVELDSLSKEEFEALVEHCFLRPAYTPERVGDIIAEACSSKYGRDNYIKLDTLKDACETLEELDDISDFRLDIHEGNLMVRRTPYGPQLVINDPFGMIKYGDLHKYQ